MCHIAEIGFIDGMKIWGHCFSPLSFGRENLYAVYGNYYGCAVCLSGLLNFWSGYMLSDACSNTAIQYATQGWLKEMKNWLS